MKRTTVFIAAALSVVTGVAGDGGGGIRIDCAGRPVLQPFTEAIAIPEGNCTVTVTLGSDTADSITTVKAESRRLMLENVAVLKGGCEKRTFTVHVRRPEIRDSDGSVKLKDREKRTNTWDADLTLEFGGARPAVRTIEVVPGCNVPTVYIAGDSTVADQAHEPWASWGQMLPRFFAPAVAVANYAESGETIRSSLFARRFDKIFSQMQSGDYLLVQFGHNDMKDKRPNALDVYRRNLTDLVVRARSHGATPVLITSMERKAGVEKNTLGEYPDTVRQVAEEQRVFLIDLHAMSKTLYRALGPDLDQAFQDGSHHNAYGSYELAKCVASAIARSDLPLARLVLPEASQFDPAVPDPWQAFAVPRSPLADQAPPEGN
jgi:lysophospholipase L1-like esterase